MNIYPRCWTRIKALYRYKWRISPRCFLKRSKHRSQIFPTSCRNLQTVSGFAPFHTGRCGDRAFYNIETSVGVQGFSVSEEQFSACTGKLWGTGRRTRKAGLKILELGLLLQVSHHVAHCRSQRHNAVRIPQRRFLLLSYILFIIINLQLYKFIWHGHC